MGYKIWLDPSYDSGVHDRKVARFVVDFFRCVYKGPILEPSGSPYSVVRGRRKNPLMFLCWNGIVHKVAPTYDGAI
eukprot:scaffold10230_cov150-Amphora_coffeaeformis.AAC.5